MIPPRSDLARIARIRIWILLLSLAPAAAALLFGRPRTASGLAAGGLIVFLNLLGTQRSVTQMIQGEGIRSVLAAVTWFGKFGVTAAVILGVLHLDVVDPIPLLVGLGSLPVSLVFDIFLFPVNKGEAKKP